MDFETRNYHRHIEVRSEGNDTFCEGYASVYFNANDPANTQYHLWGDYYERIMPGAFDEALKRPDDVRCLFNHDASQVFGRNKAGTLTLRADQVGLWFSCKLPNTEHARSLAEAIRRGDVSGCSFSFNSEKTTWREDGETTYREVNQVKLWDVGPVTYPAYAGTDVSIAQRSLEAHRRAHPPKSLDQIVAEHQRQQRLQTALKPQS